MKKQTWLLFVVISIMTIQSVNAQYSSTVNLGQQNLSIREVRSNAVTGNIGWNGLTGFGVTYRTYFAKHLGVDVGIGLATTGFKIGTRFNYIFSDKNFSPLVSGGIMYGMGFGDTEIDFENSNTGNKFSYTISSSPFAQFGGGVEYMADGGFIISGIVGYALLLNDGNYKIIRGNPTNDELSAMDMAIGSGLVLEFSIGFAFGGK